MASLRGKPSQINFMTHGDTESYPCGSTQDLFSYPPMKPFTVVLRYKDLDGESYENRSELGMKQFAGRVWPGGSVSWRQMKAIEDLVRIVGKKLRG